VVFSSLILDGIVAICLGTTIPPEVAQRIATLCAIVALPFINQKALARLITLIRGRIGGDSPKTTGSNKAIIVALIALIVMAKLALLPALNSFAAFLVAGIFLLGIVSTVKHLLMESARRSQSLSKSPWLYVMLWERQLVALFCLPIIAARLINLCGALSLGAAQKPYIGLTYLLASTVLLTALRPERSTFIGWCPSCRSPVPIAFEEYGSCPRCNKELADQF
jgi:hypothetical protein